MPSFRTDILGVPRSTASTGDSTLVVIDAQNEYATGKLAVKGVKDSVAAIADLLKKYRSGGGQIVHITHKVPDGAPVFTPNTDLAKPMNEVAPKQGEKVIQKQFPGGFAQTELDDHLKSIGAKKLVLCGYMAHVCVSTTAREGSQLGYDVILASDAIGDRDLDGGVSGEEVTKIVLIELADAFGTVLKSNEIN